MNTYIAIVNKSCNTQEVIHALHNFGDVVQLFENAYLVQTRYIASDIRDELFETLGEATQIYVCRLARGSAWKNTAATESITGSTRLQRTTTYTNSCESVWR